MRKRNEVDRFLQGVEHKLQTYKYPILQANANQWEQLLSSTMKRISFDNKYTEDGLKDWILVSLCDAPAPAAMLLSFQLGWSFAFRRRGVNITRVTEREPMTRMTASISFISLGGMGRGRRPDLRCVGRGRGVGIYASVPRLFYYKDTPDLGKTYDYH